MLYEVFSHRYGFELMQLLHPDLWVEITDALNGITDARIIEQFPKSKTKKSLSGALNTLIREELANRGWQLEAPIFAEAEYQKAGESRWRLDFSKAGGGLGVAIEVAFNHAEAISWNLIKPVLSSELNHVRKAIQTDMGVVIMATDKLKEAGGFDSAVGTYEQFRRYLTPLRTVLTVPIVLVGLKPPVSFHIEHDKVGNTMHGRIVTNDSTSHHSPGSPAEGQLGLSMPHDT